MVVVAILDRPLDNLNLDCIEENIQNKGNTLDYVRVLGSNPFGLSGRIVAAGNLLVICVRNHPNRITLGLRLLMKFLSNITNLWAPRMTGLWHGLKVSLIHLRGRNPPLTAVQMKLGNREKGANFAARRKLRRQ
jgi:hypothetical protein